MNSRVMGTLLSVLAVLAAGDSRADTAPSVQSCRGGAGVAIQVLGSGGPELAKGRASASYVVWHGGRARVLVDLGAGAMLRFGQSGARVEDLDLIALSHLHVDHSADLPALVKSAFFGSRGAALPVSGPGPDGVFPGLVDWLHAMLDSERGAFRYLSGALDGSRGQFALVPQEIAIQPQRVQHVLKLEDLEVDVIPVPHGPVPALAYRVRVGGRVIVFAGDQNGRSEQFWGFARGADVLVAHLAIPDADDAVASALHATPSRIGSGARDAGVEHLVLSHFMTRSEESLAANVAQVQSAFESRLTVADDLTCVAVPARAGPRSGA